MGNLHKPRAYGAHATLFQLFEGIFTLYEKKEQLFNSMIESRSLIW